MTHEIAIGDTVEWTTDNEHSFDGPMVVDEIDDDAKLAHIKGHAWTHLAWLRTVTESATA